MKKRTVFECMSFPDQQLAMSIICNLQMIKKYVTGKDEPFSCYENMTLQQLEDKQIESIQVYNNVNELVRWAKDNKLATFSDGVFRKVIDQSCHISVEDMFAIYHNRNLIN